jgi:hypothetical protein
LASKKPIENKKIIFSRKNVKNNFFGVVAAENSPYIWRIFHGGHLAKCRLKQENPLKISYF